MLHYYWFVNQGPFKWCVMQMGVGGVQLFEKKHYEGIGPYGSTLLALRRGGWASTFQEKCVT